MLHSLWENRLFENTIFFSVLVGVVLFLTLIVPALGMSGFAASSMAAGLTFIMFFYLIVLKITATYEEVKKHASVIIKPLIFVIVYIFLHGIVNFFWHDSFNVNRFFQTFVYLIVFICGAFSFVLVINKILSEQLDLAIKIVFGMFLLISLLALFGYSPLQEGGKAILFYTEPSHFVLDFLPLLLYVVIRSSMKYKIFFLLIGFELALLMPSITLLVGVVLVALWMLNSRDVLWVLVGFIALYFLDSLAFHDLFVQNISSNFAQYAGNTTDYIKGRVLTQEMEVVNLSKLVYLSGFERAYLNLVDYFGFGVGFQQLGFIGRWGSHMTTLNSIMGRPFGLIEGGTVAAKLISEFGMVGMFLLACYLFFSIKKALWLRAVSLKELDYENVQKIFFLSCYITFFIDLFVRGVGYFTSTGFVFFASLLWLGLSRTNIKNKNFHK